jgi:hypothetical protein
MSTPLQEVRPMREATDKLKWLSVSITVASLVMVFWVWPAWNSGSQTWYCGNNQDLINTMYRNKHPQSPYDEPFEFSGSFMGAFMANESANKMLNFGMVPWQYQIEWYRTPMTPMTMEMTPMGETETVMFSLTIGKWSGMGMMMMYVPFFSAMGQGAPGSMDQPGGAMGRASPIEGMIGDLVFMRGDFLGFMLMLMTSPNSFDVIVPVAKTVFITYPLSEPDYPGVGPGVPTLSQWGALVLAILLLFLYFLVTRRRVETGMS